MPRRVPKVWKLQNGTTIISVRDRASEHQLTRSTDMRSRVSVLALALICAATLSSVAWSADKEEKPDAKLELSAKSAAAGVGWTWGDGKVMYKGKTYPVDVDGLTVGSVGAASIEAEGTVYHLKKLADFDGTYVAASAGATVGGGAGVLAMQNEHGVVVQMKATTQGVKFTIGTSGVKLALKK
jgi:hypothetical protein